MVERMVPNRKARLMGVLICVTGVLIFSSVTASACEWDYALIRVKVTYCENAEPVEGASVTIDPEHGEVKVDDGGWSGGWGGDATDVTDAGGFAYFRFMIDDHVYDSSDISVRVEHPMYGVLLDSFTIKHQSYSWDYLYYNTRSGAEANPNVFVVHYPELFCVPELPYGTLTGLIGMIAGVIGLRFKRLCF